MQLPIRHNSNYGHISYRFWDIDEFSSKIACFPPLFCLSSTCAGTAWDINVIYLQFRRRHYGSIFIRLAVVASQNCEITRNSNKIWPYSSSRSSKVIDLGVNRKLACHFLLVINSNFGRICYRFRDIDVQAKNDWFFPPHSAWGNPLEFLNETYHTITK